MKADALRSGVLIALGALVSSLAAAIASLRAASWVAGPNVSDVGVRMYAGGGIAVLFGLFLYAVVILAVLTLAGAVAKSVRKRIWIVGGTVAVLIFLPLAWFLRFSFR